MNINTIHNRRAMIESHVNHWNSCKRCPIFRYGHAYLDIENTSLDSIDILFVGEAPGKDEAKASVPFIGASGLLLRKMIAETNPGPVGYVISNAVACRPTEDGKANRSPSMTEVRNCDPRIRELIAILSPRIIVAVGSIARELLINIAKDKEFTGPLFAIKHPAYILRNGGMHSAEYDECIKQLKEIFTEALNLHANKY